MQAEERREAALIVGDRVLSRCGNGALVVEYMLFDSAEVLIASEGVGVREHGYLTTAALARMHLEFVGISVALARECFAALKPGHLRALARSSVVLAVVERLSAYEAFEGGRFDATTHRYEGVWLDLDALAAACPLPDAALMFQALHLRLALEEVGGDAAVRMNTAHLTEHRKPNERTWRRTALEAVVRLPGILGQMRVPVRSHRNETLDEADVREDLLRNLRMRGATTPAPQHRLHSLAMRLSRPPSVPPEPPPVPRDATPAPIARTPPAPQPHVPSIPPELDLIVTDAPDEVASGPTPLFDDLRRHTEMLRGESHLVAVAKFLSAMAEQSASPPELAMLACRAWLASGEKGHARFFARRIVDDPIVPDEIRLMALEILESTAATNESQMPPPIDITEPLPPELDRTQAAPVGASLPPFASETPPVAFVVPTVLPKLTHVPPAEIVESIALPDGMGDAMLPPGAPVRDVMSARIATTRLARELARDYRLAYGTTLKTDPMAIEAMQRHLRRRFGDAQTEGRPPPALEAELMRHGALLAEILIRTLGAQWISVGDEPGRWAMLVPPSTQVWPIGRVYRFFQQGHKESDLVAFYFDLEKSARSR